MQSSDVQSTGVAECPTQFDLIEDDEPKRPLTLAAEQVYRELQQQLIGFSLTDKHRGEKTVSLADHFDRTHRPIVDAMAEAAKKGETLDRRGFVAFLTNLVERDET